MVEIREIGVVEYGNSGGGRTRIDLIDAKDDIVLHFTAHFDQKALVLNTWINEDCKRRKTQWLSLFP